MFGSCRQVGGEDEVGLPRATFKLFFSPVGDGDYGLENLWPRAPFHRQAFRVRVQVQYDIELCVQEATQLSFSTST